VRKWAWAIDRRYGNGSPNKASCRARKGGGSRSDNNASGGQQKKAVTCGDSEAGAGAAAAVGGAPHELTLAVKQRPREPSSYS